MVREGFFIRGYFSIRGSERRSDVYSWGKCVLVRENCKCKYFDVGVCLSYCKNCKEVSVEGSELE